VSPYSPHSRKPELVERGLVFVDDGGKPHPAIVVRILRDSGRAIVLCGTGTERHELVVIQVPATTRSAKALNLTKTTYFYADSLKDVALSHLRPEAGKCPPDLFLQVRLLSEGAIHTKGLARLVVPQQIESPPVTEGC
jgi:hypothetical protein